jgi:arsenical pump membrane protein
MLRLLKPVPVRQLGACKLPKKEAFLGLFASHLSFVLIWIVSLASILGMLLRPRGLAEAWWACGGAVLLIVTGLMPLRLAGHAIAEGLDVYLFLTGMMVLAEIAREEHVFDWAAGVAAVHAKGSPRRLFLLVYMVGIVVTALLSNDATAVVLTPAVLEVVRRARINPKPYLLACAFVANAASFVFPISNPANLVVFGPQIPSLFRWLGIFLLPSGASIVVTYLCVRWHGRSDLKGTISGELEDAPLTAEGKLALSGLLLAAIALIASSALGLELGLPTCAAALVALVVVSTQNRRIVTSVVRGVSWSVLPLVAGLFVVVDALHSAGLLQLGPKGLNGLAQLPAWAAKVASALAVALASNCMNNLPVGLVGGAAIRAAHESGLMAHSILIGVDLGPNLSVTGSLATILWLIALRREKVEISAFEFFRLGLFAMPAALLASLILLWR